MGLHFVRDQPHAITHQQGGPRQHLSGGWFISRSWYKEFLLRPTLFQPTQAGLGFPHKTMNKDLRESCLGSEPRKRQQRSRGVMTERKLIKDEQDRRFSLWEPGTYYHWEVLRHHTAHTSGSSFLRDKDLGCLSQNSCCHRLRAASGDMNFLELLVNLPQGSDAPEIRECPQEKVTHTIRSCVAGAYGNSEGHNNLGRKYQNICFKR